MDMAAKPGPPDPSKWITRKAGPIFETHMLETMDHVSNYMIVLNTWIKANHIDPVKIEQAYRAMIYNQPNFRADVKKEEDGSIYFVPATDFSDVFEFVDQSTDGESSGYAGCWRFAEELADAPFPLGSGYPLNKCYLVKRPDGYNLLNKFHHAIGDGTTSFAVVNEIMRQYDLLVSGEEVELAPAKVMPSAEELCLFAKNDDVLEKMVQSKIKRVQGQKFLFPLNQEEVAASSSQIPFKNRTLHALGTEEGFTNLKSSCKELGVTLGSYSFAALMLAQAAVYIRRNGGKIPEDGIPTIYTDVLANVRTRLKPNPGPCFMMCISVADVTATVDGETRLFDLVANIGEQLQIVYEEDRIPLFFICEELLQEKGCDLSNSKLEFTISNQLGFNYPTKYSWGEIMSTHTIGSYWCPTLCNQVIMFQSVNKAMCYTAVCCDGEDNVRDTKEVFDLFVHILEHSDSLNETTGVMDLINFDKN